eukprot:1161933-Pelagomonas_calceolata.AAC.1
MFLSFWLLVCKGMSFQPEASCKGLCTHGFLLSSLALAGLKLVGKVKLEQTDASVGHPSIPHSVVLARSRPELRIRKLVH